MIEQELFGTGENMFENFKVPKELIPDDPRFGVGPSLIPTQAVEALVKSGHNLLGTSHRKMPVRNLVKQMQEGIRTYFNLPSDYQVVIGNGGATFVWDLIGFNLVEEKSLHFICGEFSDKWHRAHNAMPWVETKEVRVEYGMGINPVEEEGYDLICCTLNETSTGVQLSHIPKLTNANTLMAVDATSGAGQIQVNFNDIDFYYFSPQKVFASDGGFYVAIMSPKAVKRVKKIHGTRFIPESLKLQYAIENSLENQTYNTPSIATIFFLNEQVKLMNKVGQDKVIAESKRKAKLMYDWIEEKPYLSAFVLEKEFRSDSVVTIDVDKQYIMEDLTRVLREQDVAFDIDGYRKLGRNQLRIALFYNVSYSNLKKLTQVISLAIENNS